MARYKLTPLVVNSREFHVQFIANGLVGATVYGKENKSGSAQFYEMNLNDGFVMPSQNLNACKACESNPKFSELYDEVKAELERNLRKWRMDDDPMNVNIRRDEIIRCEAMLKNSYAIYQEAQKRARYRGISEVIHFPKPPASVEFLIRLLLTTRANGVDLYPTISKRYLVPKFSCKPDKFTNGWYIQDREGASQTVEWLVDQVESGSGASNK